MGYRYLCFTILVGLFSSCQDDGDLKKIQQLSSVMNEVSGITTVPGSDLIWMINDSGNKNVVYGYKLLGDIEREIMISNAENIDWEDIASDDEGNLYIADFGNGRDHKKELKILKIPSPITFQQDTIAAEIISFSLTINKANKDDFKKFNAEALLYLDEQLYIFSKNRNDENGGHTYVFTIPAKQGTYKATYLGDLRTCEGRRDCYITAAALSPDKKTIALLSHDRVFLLSDFITPHFLKGKLQEFNFKHSSQKESVTYKNDSTLYIADERRIHTGGNLFEYSLKK